MIGLTTRRNTGYLLFRHRHYAAQEGALLAQDEAAFLGEAEIGGAFRIGFEPRPIGFVGGKAVERDQRIGDVVGALVRQPVAEEIAAAARNDGEPAPRVFLERVELVRV